MISSPFSVLSDTTNAPAAVQAVTRQARRVTWHLAGFSLAINILALALPLFVLQVFDRVLTSHSMSTLWALAGGCVLALAVMAALDVVRGRVLARAGQGIERELAPAYVAAGHSDALADVARVRGFVAGPAMCALLDLPWSPLFIAVAFVVHPAIGWIALGGALCLLAVAWAAELHLRGPGLAAGSAEARARRLADAGVDDERKAQDLADKWRRVQEPAWHARLVQADRAGLYATAARFIRLTLQVLVIAAAAVLATAGEISAGGMIAALVLLARGLAPFEKAQDLWRGFVAARVSLSRLARLSVAPRAKRPFVAAAGEDAVLDVRNVARLRADASEPLFAGVRFKARGGDMIGITGPSGAGKSTFLAMAAGREPVDQGRIFLNGQQVLGSDGCRLDAPVGYLPQSPALVPGTVAENIACFASGDLTDVIEAARRAGADADIRALAHGYDTPVGPGGVTVSAGLVQRIALARVLFAKPQVLLLDEPYTHLDNAGVDNMIAGLDDLRRDGVLVLIVSQRPSVLAHCSRVLLMDGGRARMIDRRRKADLRVLTNDRPAAEPAAADTTADTAAEQAAASFPRKSRKKSGA
jgi:ABC-type protease/lipase transport system fused ATPase/permease subunit